MKMNLDCIPCLFRQAIETARSYGDDPELQRAVINEVAAVVPSMGAQMSAPEVVGLIHENIRRHFGDRDIYKTIKERSNRKALELYPALKQKVAGSEDPLFTAVEIAIIGNVIDYAAKNQLNIEEEIEHLFAGNLPDNNRSIFEYEALQRDIERAKNILILGDNAGEIVFDKVLIETLPGNKDIYYAVRGRTILNDVTMQDAEFCGLDKIAVIVSSGVTSPGTVLSQCSREFLDLFHSVDIILSKGQGNYEALSGTERPVYFLLKVKCAIIAKNSGAQLGDIILTKG